MTGPAAASVLHIDYSGCTTCPHSIAHRSYRVRPPHRRTARNSALGKWLLRDVLNLKERELLTYDKLQTIGLDTAVVYKIDNDTYDIDFTRIGSYENFLAENGEKAEEVAEDEDEGEE